MASSDSHAHQRLYDYAEQIRSLVHSIRRFPELADESAQLERAVEGLVRPFELAVFGRMKTGKSSILNAYLGHPLTITGVNEATATINRIVYGSGAQLQSFRVHWKDEAPSICALSELQAQWNGTSDEVLQRIRRVRYLEFYADIPRLQTVRIIDTPGTGSTAGEHEAIAQQFIGGRETDALVYVCPFEVRETDLRDLSTFRESGLSTPTPYNCVSLLHKWDLVYWNNGGDMEEVNAKARRLEEQLQGLVACVLPVSAPLAMAAKSAAPEFWQRAREVLAEFSDEKTLTRALSRDEKWQREAHRADLYAEAHRAFDMPWDSFRVMLRHLYRLPAEADAGAAVMELSGFKRLNDLLEHRFFYRASLLQQRRVRAGVRSALKATFGKIEALCTEWQRDETMLRRIAAQIPDPELSRWAELKAAAAGDQRTQLERASIGWDRRMIELGETCDLADRVLELDLWLNSPDNSLSGQHSAWMQNLGNVLVEREAQPLPPKAWRELNQAIATLRYSSDESQRKAGALLDDVLKGAAHRIFPT